MRKLLAAAVLVSAVSLTTLAIAQKPLNQDGQYDPTITSQAPPVAYALPATPTPDARSLASDAEVGEARRTYRAACEQHESPSFCECVGAGVSQALMPAEVRIAARTIGDRISAQGDARIASETDNRYGAESSAERIAQVEGHYAGACQQFRR